MRLRQGLADFKFLTNRERALCTNNLQQGYSAAQPALNSLQIDDFTEIHLCLICDELADFLLRVFNSPCVEIERFLIVVVEHLRNNVRILGVAIWILNRLEVRQRSVFPAILIFFGNTATAL